MRRTSTTTTTGSSAACRTSPSARKRTFCACLKRKCNGEETSMSRPWPRNRGPQSWHILQGHHFLGVPWNVCQQACFLGLAQILGVQGPDHRPPRPCFRSPLPGYRARIPCTPSCSFFLSAKLIKKSSTLSRKDLRLVSRGKVKATGRTVPRSWSSLPRWPRPTRTAVSEPHPSLSPASPPVT